MTASKVLDVNKLFEKVKVQDTELDSGYNTWYKSGENKKMENVKLSDFDEVFEKKRLEAKKYHRNVKTNKEIID